jgi:hypothetical protein
MLFHFDMRSGCRLVKLSPDRESADIEDSNGVRRRLARERPRDLPPINDVAHDAEDARKAKRRPDDPEPPKKPSLRDVALAANRIKARPDARCANVGFRCVQDVYVPPQRPASANPGDAPKAAPAK